MDADKPVIIIKKGGGHGGHSGGAWKVAFADFMTAMMAFFLVMWLTGTASAPTKQNIASYFRRPGLFSEGSGTPLEIGGSGILDDAYIAAYPEEKANEVGESQKPKRKGFEEGPYPATEDNLGASEERVPAAKKTAKPDEKAEENATPEAGSGSLPSEESGEGTGEGTGESEEALMDEVRDELEREIQSSPELEQLIGTVDVITDADGLIIEIMDTEKTSMFTSGSAFIREDAREAFSHLANAIAKVKNQIEIVGHTDSHPFSSRNNGYSNWELSVDRANAARRLLIADNVDPARMVGVLGKADTMPKNPADPFAASNRRITLKMKFDTKKKEETEKSAQRPKRTRQPVPEQSPSPSSSEYGRVIDMKADPDADQKLRAASEEDRGAVSTQTLERIHSLNPQEINQSARSGGAAPKPSSNSRAPASAARPPAGWKDPKFFGDQ